MQWEGVMQTLGFCRFETIGIVCNYYFELSAFFANTESLSSLAWKKLNIAIVVFLMKLMKRELKNDLAE